MTEENKEKVSETEVNHQTENIESIGQMLLGGIETIGGILTGDPIAHAEGEYNVEAGLLRQESNRVLTAIEEDEDATRKTSESSNKS